LWVSISPVQKYSDDLTIGYSARVTNAQRTGCIGIQHHHYRNTTAHTNAIQKLSVILLALLDHVLNSVKRFLSMRSCTKKREKKKMKNIKLIGFLNILTPWYFATLF
jgi:hypothetical protein